MFQHQGVSLLFRLIGPPRGLLNVAGGKVPGIISLSDIKLLDVVKSDADSTGLRARTFNGTSCTVQGNDLDSFPLLKAQHVFPAFAISHLCHMTLVLLFRSQVTAKIARMKLRPS